MKYLIIIFLLFIPNVFSQDNFYLNKEGWCASLEIPFTVYNQSEWDEREEIEDDEDRNFSKLSFDVTIFNGPFDLGEPLFEKTFKDEILPTFSQTFDDEGPYLIEIKPNKGNFSQFEETLNIRECKAIVREKYTLNLEIDSEVTILIENTELEDTTELNLEKKTNDEFNLDDNYEVYEFSGDTNISGDITITLDINPQEDIHEVYIINKETKELNLLSNTNLDKISNKISFSLNNFEIFALFQNKKEETIIIENITSTPENENNNNTEIQDVVIEKPKEDLERNKSILDYSIWIIVSIIVILFVILAPKLFGTKTQKETYHEERDKDARKKITSSKEAYEKTKEYTVKYKNQYPRESIEKSLKTSGVSDEIIQLVFSEEY